jgi:hypothetical protein
MRESEQEADKGHLAEEVKDELYCTMQAKVVGIQYYNGMRRQISFVILTERI